MTSVEPNAYACAGFCWLKGDAYAHVATENHRTGLHVTVGDGPVAWRSAPIGVRALCGRNCGSGCGCGDSAEESATGSLHRQMVTPALLGRIWQRHPVRGLNDRRRAHVVPFSGFTVNAADPPSVILGGERLPYRSADMFSVPSENHGSVLGRCFNGLPFHTSMVAR